MPLQKTLHYSTVELQNNRAIKQFYSFPGQSISVLLGRPLFCLLFSFNTLSLYIYFFMLYFDALSFPSLSSYVLLVPPQLFFRFCFTQPLFSTGQKAQNRLFMDFQWLFPFFFHLSYDVSTKFKEVDENANIKQ